MFGTDLILIPGADAQGFWRAPPEPAGAGHTLFQHFWVQTGPLPLPEAGSQSDGVPWLSSSVISYHMCVLASCIIEVPNFQCRCMHA